MLPLTPVIKFGAWVVFCRWLITPTTAEPAPALLAAAAFTADQSPRVLPVLPPPVWTSLQTHSSGAGTAGVLQPLGDASWPWVQAQRKDKLGLGGW